MMGSLHAAEKIASSRMIHLLGARWRVHTERSSQQRGLSYWQVGKLRKRLTKNFF